MFFIAIAIIRLKMKLQGFILFSLFFWSCTQRQKQLLPNTTKNLYDHFEVKGCFVIYDAQNKSYQYYNEQLCQLPYIPASTFKICNSLIGLETGIIKDENYIIPWDRMTRNPVWDKDHDLKTAFKNSTVWYFQELARRVGEIQMRTWLKKLRYGNMNTDGGIDKFWLRGALRISPLQQIDFLQKLHNTHLPCSKRNINIVKNIMVVKDSSGIVLRAKSGWGNEGHRDIGWYVGYIENKNQLYYFANCIFKDSKSLNELNQSIKFDHARKDIAISILKQLNLLK
jgi:beta-lactamase class D